MSNKCYKCFRKKKSCYCSSLIPINTGIKFIFLMHPKEAYKQKTGTGRLTSLSLIDSEIIIGIDFTNNERLNNLISGKGDFMKYFPVLLYPSEETFFTDTPKFQELIKGHILLVILIDATWFFAQKMLYLSKNLHILPKLSFNKEYRSQFTIKKQPHPACLSTIESTYYLIEELKSAGITNPSLDQSGLLKVFHQMIDFQQNCMQIRHESEAAIQYPDLFDE